MKIGIIGPSRSGKTTLFKTLLETNAAGDKGVVRIADGRMERLSAIFSSKKSTYPEFIFQDIGPISSFTKREMSALHDVDLFVCTIGAFFSEDPKRDFDSLLTDVILFDLEVVQNRISRLKKEGKKRDLAGEPEILEKCQAFLSDGILLHKAPLSGDELRLLSGTFLVTLRPLILAINIGDEDTAALLEEKTASLERYCISKGLGHIRFFGKTELELMELEPAERKNFSQELRPGYNFKEELSLLISRELELITFFTAGEKETRGWHLRSGLNAHEAAGKIHSDIKKGFIRAEVVSWDDFLKYGSMHKAREAGRLRLEGKEYVVKDGDIINVRFNV